MATIGAALGGATGSAATRRSAVARVDVLALALVGVAVTGALVALVGHVIPVPTAPSAASDVPEAPSTLGTGVGELPILGDPIRDLTMWFSARLSDANRAGVESLAGRFLTPLDPLDDRVTRDLYGSVLMLVVPLLVVGGIVLGYLMMSARTTGEGAYAVRSVTPRFVVGAALAILGIFLVSVLATFVATTDTALVEASVTGAAVGDASQWPAAGGPFLVLQRAGYDPNLGEGPGLWNTGAWLSAGFLSAVLVTLLGMVNAMLSGLERLLVIVAPLCLAAYALPATQRVANMWLKVLGAVLAVRFAWSILFIVFGLQAVGQIDASGGPITGDSVRILLGIALGTAGVMLVVPIVVIPLVLWSPGPLRAETG